MVRPAWAHTCGCKSRCELVTVSKVQAHRLRAIQLRHWKRSRTICRELKALGAAEDVAKQVAGNGRRWWRNSNGAIKRVLTMAYFDQLGVHRLS